MKTVKVHKVIRTEKGKDLLVTKSIKFRLKKNFVDSMKRWWCTNKKSKCYIKCNESREIFGGNVMHKHDEDNEACLNRQILNNSAKRKAMEDLCETPRKLIHKELQSQDLDTFAYKYIMNISRNIHQTRSSQMFRLPTDTEETHYVTVRILILLFLYLHWKKERERETDIKMRSVTIRRQKNHSQRRGLHLLKNWTV